MYACCNNIRIFAAIKNLFMMKKTITAMMGALLVTLSGMGATATDTLTVRIKGMRCEECAHKVGNVLRKDQGVDKLAFNLERRTVTVSYDCSKTCADSIAAHLAATGRYKASAYSPTDTIMRGIGLQMADMHCQNCANRIVKRMEAMTGIDSIAPHVDKHYVFFRYDANHQTKDNICKALADLGFTPVNYYTSKNISYAYFNIPAEAVTDETLETALSLDGVDDAAVNARQKSLALTYINTETTEDKLLEELKAAGVAVVVPPEHECKEE